MRKYLILIFIMLIFFEAYSIENLHLYPVLDYADETDVSGGGVLTYFFRTFTGSKTTPPSRIYLKLKTGLEGHLDFKAELEHQLEKGKYLLNGSIYYNDYSYTYSGIGNEISDIDKKFDVERLNYRFSISRRWDSYLFGFTYTGKHFRNREPLVYELDEDSYSLYGGGWSSGPGLSLEYDTRDNHYFPHKGIYISLKMQNYSKPLRSDYSFDAYEVKCSFYQKIYPMFVAAARISFSFNDGENPFHEMYDLNNEIRGFSSGAVKDKFLTSGTIELRLFPFTQKFWERIGIAAFFESGEAASEMREFCFDELHYSYGVGCRYLLNLKELYTVRFDYGISKKQSSMDFSASEAF